MLQLLDRGIPYSSHFLKFALSSKALPLFHVIPMEAYSGSLQLMVLEGKGMGVDASTASW